MTKEYKEFAEWYLKTFSGGILTSMLKNLDQYRRPALDSLIVHFLLLSRVLMLLENVFW